MFESVARGDLPGRLAVMDAVILSVGTELVTGQCLDTNAAWISSRLTEYGVRVVRHVTVGDELKRLSMSIRHAIKAGNLVVMTGGLGPTEDDLTRHAVAAALGVKLEKSAEATKQVTAFFAQWGRRMSDTNLRQALVPQGCAVIANPRGSAPGILWESDGTMLVAMPGVPAEMKAMFESVILPQLDTRGRAIVSQRVQCFGISESKVGEILSDMMGRERNPLVGTTASDGVISIRVIASGSTRETASQRLEADLSEIERRIGDPVFGRGDRSLQESVASLLQRTGQTVATAESCTGGLIAKRLTDVPGSSAYFPRGFVTYGNDSKMEELGVRGDLIEKNGAVSESVARAMARGCRVRAKSDFAIAVTGIAGPGGGCPPDKPVGLVYVALSWADDCDVRRYQMGEHLTRGEVRDRAAKHALNLLRLVLLESLRHQGK